MRMKYHGITLLLILLHITWTLSDQMVQDEFISARYNYSCLPSDSQLRPRYKINKESISILTNHDVFSQIISRIFAIFLREVLGYRSINIIDSNFAQDAIEGYKIYHTLKYIDDHIHTIDLSVPMPADYHFPPDRIDTIGSIGTVRFGWFIPKKLMYTDKRTPFIPYTILQDPSQDVFKQFVLDASIVHDLDSFSGTCSNCGSSCDIYIPERCRTNQCATVLSSRRGDTGFVTHFIDEYKLYVQIYWLGDCLESVKNQLIQVLINQNQNTVSNHKSFLIFHWTPSEIISDDYEMLTMPPCQSIKSRNETFCKYELATLLKYHSEDIKQWAPNIRKTLFQLTFNDEHKQNIFYAYNNFTANKYPEDLTALNLDLINSKNFTKSNRGAIFNEIACEWIKNNEAYYKHWVPADTKLRIFIAGIFPKKATSISKAVRMAQEAVNDAMNKTDLLEGISLELYEQREECHSENVMKPFVQIYKLKQDLLGVLGPHCSEMLEPLASASKYFQIPVITYSAEGTSFYDRAKYPYTFRTIGENRQFVHVHKRLFEKFEWRRVATFSEENQKYTEYISHVESDLHENNIEVVLSRKFTKLPNSTLIQILKDIKRKNAKIIIAEFDDEQTEIVMCEAYKQEMTADKGFVWFLPAWSAEKWRLSNGESYCVRENVEKMLDGHFFLNHAPFGDEDSIMQENRTVKEWIKSFNSKFNNTNKPPIYDINYVGYAYDAFWAYALALDKLVKEKPAFLLDNSQNSTKRLTQLIANTDFNGVSGHIQFGEGGSRFSVTQVFQHINGRSREIGSFHPNVSEENGKLSIVGGRFQINSSEIIWLTPNRKMPDDGRIACNFEFIASVIGFECITVHYILIGFLCIILIIAISVASFIYWKWKYDIKLKQSAKVMRNFGIDLLSTKSMPANTLDKWEVSKDHVVINRRLGEGAFGTVYGGEAQINDDGWTAVAVKTLKKGSTTEDRLDFLSEAEAMKRFDHTNIVKLLGVCLQTEPIYTIMEFMLYGDLKTYLLARRHLVNQKITEDSDFSPKRLTMMALDVARALSFLADQKYVHRDVACRNCLVNAQRVVKLGDFGMARSMFESDYYRFSRKGMLPVRWMAPESLILGIFTPASDVWSFGVLLYEIITFGSFPFQGLTNSQVLDYIKAGNTLTIPNGVKPPLEGLMKACWNASHKKRPSASEVADFISHYPRLLAPCLDVPLASVQMPETDSDQLELLPGLRKRHNQSMNDLHKSFTVTTFDGMTSTLPNGITLKDFNNPSDDSEPSTNGAISNTYNPIEPLLQYETEMTNNDSSLWRYVPMNGTRRKNKSLEKVNTSVI